MLFSAHPVGSHRSHRRDGCVAPWGNSHPLRAPLPRRTGFTLIELLVTIGIVAVLASLILAVINKGHSAAQNANCLANLRSISFALMNNARTHGDYFPDPVALNQSWEQCLRPSINDRRIFQCPGDYEIYPAIGSSYDWRDTSVSNTTFAGHTVHDMNRTNAVLAFESLPGWHARQKINATFIDGSAQTMEQSDCLADLQTPIRSP